MSAASNEASSSLSVFGFLKQALNVSLIKIKIKLWHGLAITALACLSLFNLGLLEQVYNALAEYKPLVSFVNLVLNVIPFVAVGLIWTLRKLLQEQIDRLGEQLTNVGGATGALSAVATNVSLSIAQASQSAEATATSASRSIAEVTQTAAEGLSISSQGAATDIGAATHGMSQMAGQVSDALNQTTTRLRDEAEIARQKLEEQSGRIRNEIERLAEDLETRTRQIIDQLGTNTGVEVAKKSASAEAVESWEKIRVLWKDARDAVAGVIEQADGRTTRHLKFDYRKYGDVARTLEGATLLFTEGRTAVENMDRRFNQLKFNWRDATKKDVANFEAWLAELRDAIQKSPMI